MEDPRKLHVVCCITNPQRYRSRYELYRDFEKHVEDSGAVLWVAEAAFGDRQHVVTDPSNPRHFRFRTRHEIWLKERMLNLLVQRLPSDWQYVAWVDADVHFNRPDWVTETIEQLQHHGAVQMFSQVMDLAPSYEAIRKHDGFAFMYRQAILSGQEILMPPTFCPYPYGHPRKLGSKAPRHWHPGFCWAWRRDAYEGVGGWIDIGILGAGDQHMARGLVGQMLSSIHPGMSERYRSALLEWERRAERTVRRNIGYVPGLLTHHWHGKKVDRKYWDRWKIMVNNQFDPTTDIAVAADGLYQLVDHLDMRSIQLRDQLQHYFKARNEDSIDVPASEIAI